MVSIHLVYFGHLSFEGMHSYIYDSTTNAASGKLNSFRSNHKDAVKEGLRPRVIYIGDDLFNKTPPYLQNAGRIVVPYPAEFSDVTQVYDRKDDEEISDSVEMKFFPMHETDADCVPMSPWQTLSFRK